MNDDEKLSAMITTLESEGGHHLVEADEQEALITWLKELREIRARENAEVRTRIMHVLMDRKSGCHGLTQEEAERVWAKFGAKVMPDFESGPCRLCEGKGRVDEFTSTGCFGSVVKMVRCFACSGTGTDTHRIKVPSP